LASAYVIMNERLNLRIAKLEISETSASVRSSAFLESQQAVRDAQRNVEKHSC